MGVKDTVVIECDLCKTDSETFSDLHKAKTSDWANIAPVDLTDAPLWVCPECVRKVRAATGM